jgi:SAM-dependent methyltransferase
MTYDWEKYFEGRLKELAREDAVLDIGGGEPFQKYMAEHRRLFEGKRFETLDASPAYNPTYVGNAEALPFGDGSRSALLCISVLEHLNDPKKAVEEMYRVLTPGGKVLVYTHFIYPYHARPGVYGDFCRFTESQMRYLFKQFSHVEVRKQGGYFRAMGFFMPLQAKFRFLWEPVAYALDKLFKTEKRSTTVGYYIYAVK